MSAQEDMLSNRRLCITLCDKLGLVSHATALRAPQHASAWAMRQVLADVYTAADAIHAAMVTLHETAKSSVVDAVIGDTGVNALKLKEAAEKAGIAAQRYIEEDAAQTARGLEPGLAIGARRGWR